ncbi:MAG TPA: hypothetical protein VK211_24240 [Kamptonema sp.]|nr:hypothetical protein [Kamptonema sp.]
MKKITVETVDVIYFNNQDNWEDLESLDIPIWHLSYYRKLELKSEVDVRLILVITPWAIKRNFVNYSTFVNYLYWNNGQDLQELDSKVENNTWTNKDFYDSVITRYQKTMCFNCDSAWDTLVIDDGNYFRNRGLETIKFRQSIIKSCPQCRASLRQSVVKIF